MIEIFLVCYACESLIFNTHAFIIFYGCVLTTIFCLTRLASEEGNTCVLLQAIFFGDFAFLPSKLI